MAPHRLRFTRLDALILAIVFGLIGYVLYRAHSHFNYHPLIVGNTLMLTNQLGYIHLNESKGFRRNAYFSI